jgi:hypothetical protein
MCITVGLQTIFHAQHVGMFYDYIRITFHMPSSSGLLLISITPEVREHFRKAAILTHRPISRQRLGKHTPTGANARNKRTPIARQRMTIHT